MGAVVVVLVVRQMLDTVEPEFASIDQASLIVPSTTPRTSRSMTSSVGPTSLVKKLMNPEPNRWGGARSSLTLEYDGGIECRLVGVMCQLSRGPVRYDTKIVVWGEGKQLTIPLIQPRTITERSTRRESPT